jgi:hypothetical protein
LAALASVRWRTQGKKIRTVAIDALLPLKA